MTRELLLRAQSGIRVLHDVAVPETECGEYTRHTNYPRAVTAELDDALQVLFLADSFEETCVALPWLYVRGVVAIEDDGGAG